MPASRRAENSERVATYVQNFEDAPRRSAQTHRKRVATYSQNFEDAPCAGVRTRRKQRGGRHLRPEFRGRSTRQRHDARKTMRGSPLTPRILWTLHAPASRRAQNNERVATYVQNFEDALRASVMTRRPTDRPTDRPTVSLLNKRKATDGPTDRPTVRPTDRPTVSLLNKRKGERG